jgi:hypothetical protein
LTIIVGIRCEDGVVIAADSQATLGNLGQGTTIQDVQKIAIPQGQPVILGFSGNVGLGQKIILALSDEWGGIKGGNLLNARNRLRDVIWAQVGPELEHAALAASVVGEKAAQSSSVCLTLIALLIQGKPTLLLCDHQCGIEEVTLDLPFTSIGVGQGMADPFLAFVKKTLWGDRAPKTVFYGTLGAIWALDHVIDRFPSGGIGGKVTVGRLYQKSGKWVAELLEQGLIDEHRQQISEAVGKLTEYLGEIKKAA